MKLLIVASTNQTATANYLIAALRRAGQELYVCSDLKGPDVDEVVSGVFDAAATLRRARFAADALLFIEGGSMRLLPDTSGLRDCICAWYAIDTHMDFKKHVRLGRLFDVTFVAQFEFVRRLEAAGVSAVEWLPLAFPSEFAGFAGTPRAIDIAWVGSEDPRVHPLRSALLGRIRETFESVSLGRAVPEEMARIYARAQIVFNKSVNNDLNMRYFEAMGSGAVLLTDRLQANGVERLFEEGRHFVTYADGEDLTKTAKSLLLDEPRLRAIGEEARRLVLAEHTYDHRAAAIVGSLAHARKRASADAHDLAGAALSLGLVADTMRATATAMDVARGGTVARASAGLARLWLWPLVGMIRAIEVMQRALARHGR